MPGLYDEVTDPYATDPQQPGGMLNDALAWLYRQGGDPQSAFRRYLSTSGEALSEAPPGIARGIGDIGQMLHGLAQRQGMAEAGLPPAPESELAPVGPGARALGGLADFATGGYAHGLSGAGLAARSLVRDAVAPVLADEGGALRLFHGGPHDFDRFDINRIGTGEGAQSYGRGLYFAENEGVARQYRENLSPRPYGDAAHDTRQFWVKEHGGDTEAAARAYLDYAGDQANPQFADYVRNPPGKMYEASINAEPEHFLDWDKPASQWSNALLNKVRDMPAVRGMKLGDITGARLYDELANNLRMGSKTATGGRTEAAEALREAGIPGIRYLDQGSRSAGEGTHNYVVFDDKLIDIIKKYGLAGLITGGGAAAGAFGFSDPAQAQQPRIATPGLLEPGNIDLNARPVVKNPDGSISTVRSLGVNIDGREVLIPTVSPTGQILDNDAAVELYRRTGQHLGMFDTPENSTAYSQRLHEDQARQYVPQ